MTYAHGKTCNEEVEAATKYLREKIVPTFAKQLEGKFNEMKRHLPPSPRDLTRSLSATKVEPKKKSNSFLQGELIAHTDFDILKLVFHQSGVNLRYLGMVLYYLSIIQMIAFWLSLI